MARSSRPAKNPESRENQLIDLAIRQAERQLQDGTAPPSIVNHFLKLATTRENLEKQRLENENELLRAKIEMARASQRSEEKYQAAIDAMKRYNRRHVDEDL